METIKTKHTHLFVNCVILLPTSDYKRHLPRLVVKSSRVQILNFTPFKGSRASFEF